MKETGRITWDQGGKQWEDININEVDVSKQMIKRKHEIIRKDNGKNMKDSEKS